MRQPLIAVAYFEVCSVGLAVAVAGVIFWAVRDATLTSVLRSIVAESTFTVVVLALAILLLTFGVAKWSNLGAQPMFQRYGGLAAGGIFSAFLVSYAASLSTEVVSTYAGLESAQNLMLSALADPDRAKLDQRANFTNPSAMIRLTSSADGRRLSATSTQFHGTLIAQGQQDLTQLYWDVGKRRDLGKIYQGTLQQGPDNVVNVNILDGSETIPARSTYLRETLGVGTRVLALVPPNASEASKVYSVDTNQK